MPIASPAWPARARPRSTAASPPPRPTRSTRRWRCGAGRRCTSVRYESFAVGEVARLEEMRLACLGARIEADLALGRHEQVLGELAALVAEHPLRESLRLQLVRALESSGRRAEALEAARARAARAGRRPRASRPRRSSPRCSTASRASRRCRRAARWSASRPTCAAPRSVGPLDPEVLEEVMRCCSDEAATVLRRHGDPVVERLPDGLVAVFGIAGEPRGRRAARGPGRHRAPAAAGRARARGACALDVRLGVTAGTALVTEPRRAAVGRRRRRGVAAGARGRRRRAAPRRAGAGAARRHPLPARRRDSAGRPRARARRARRRRGARAPGRPGRARDPRRRARDRQVAARPRARAPRGARRAGADRPLPGLRRRRHLLAAARDGAPGAARADADLGHGADRRRARGGGDDRGHPRARRRRPRPTPRRGRSGCCFTALAARTAARAGLRGRPLGRAGAARPHRPARGRAAGGARPAAVRRAPRAARRAAGVGARGRSCARLRWTTQASRRLLGARSPLPERGARAGGRAGARQPALPRAARGPRARAHRGRLAPAGAARAAGRPPRHARHDRAPAHRGGRDRRGDLPRRRPGGAGSRRSDAPGCRPRSSALARRELVLPRLPVHRRPARVPLRARARPRRRVRGDAAGGARRRARAAGRDGCADLGAAVPEASARIGTQLERAHRAASELRLPAARLEALAHAAAARLAEAAANVHRRGDLPSEIAFLERALALLAPGDGARAELLPAMGVALFEASSLERAERVADEAVAAGIGSRAPARRGRARAHARLPAPRVGGPRRRRSSSPRTPPWRSRRSATTSASRGRAT